MMSFPLVKYVLTAATRDRLMMTLLLMIFISAAVAVFMGSATTTEQGSFALVFGAGGLRFLGVLGVSLFCCFYVRRSFDTKEVEFLLSRPISRLSFLMSHAAAFILLSVFIATVITGVISLIGRPDHAGLLLWGAGLGAEFSVVAITALFFSMVLSSAAGAALATLGWYALARMMGVLLGIMDLPPMNWSIAIMGNVMEVVSVIIPRLDLTGQTGWLVYGVDGSAGFKFLSHGGDVAKVMMQHIGLTGFIGLQSLLFIALLLSAAAYDFARREF